MKPEELRINNYVTINNPQAHPDMKGVPLLVTGIAQAKSLQTGWTYSVMLNRAKPWKSPDNSFAQLIEFIEPITLTEEWLLKFGAVFINQTQMRKTFKIEIDNWEFNFYMTGDDTLDELVCVKDGDEFILLDNLYLMAKVHQMQNIIFDLSGKELEILNHA